MESLLELTLWRQLLVLIPMGIALCIAAYTDWRERKVFNWLSYSAILVGLAIHPIAYWSISPLGGVIAAVVTFVVGLVMFAFLPGGWFSGGDIKLLVAVAAFLGFEGLGEVLFYSVFCGAILGLVMALFNGYLWEMLKRMFRYLRSLVRAAAYQSTQVRESLERDDRSRVPFAIAILAGAILAYTDARYGWPGVLDWYIEGLSPS
jgi:prepilin peptidase CpaA